MYVSLSRYTMTLAALNRRSHGTLVVGIDMMRWRGGGRAQDSARPRPSLDGAAGASGVTG